MVNSEANFIGTPNNALLKLPPENDDNELYMTDEENVAMYVFSQEDLDDLETAEPNLFDPLEDPDDEEYFFSDDSASTYDVYEESAHSDHDYVSESDYSSDASMELFAQTDTNSSNGS